LQEAVLEADREIEEEIRRAEHSSARTLLGDGTVEGSEIQRVKEAAAKGASTSVDLVDFLARATMAAGGRCERNGTIRVETPPRWRSPSVQSIYEHLLPPTAQISEDEPNQIILDPEHPLLLAAVRWVKASRFDASDDHRLAYGGRGTEQQHLNTCANLERHYR
jgi:hypothetical protein